MCNVANSETCSSRSQSVYISLIKPIVVGLCFLLVIWIKLHFQQVLQLFHLYSNYWKYL